MKEEISRMFTSDAASSYNRLHTNKTDRLQDI